MQPVHGGYEIDGNSLTISELALTKACPERLTGVDNVLVRTLRRVAASLTVLDSNCSTPTSGWCSPTGRLVPPTCRDGGWSSVCSTATKKLSPPDRRNEITANFKQDGQLQGNGGCNSYSGSYEVQGNTISIGDSAATQKECAQPRGLMRQENRYFQALNQAVTLKSRGGTWCSSTARVSAWSPTARPADRGFQLLLPPSCDTPDSTMPRVDM